VEIELNRERLPPTLPLDVGMNEMLKATFCPAGRLRGKVGPLRLKPAPTTVALETVTVACPELPTTRG
jgi:hypothetical protein